MNNSTNSFFLYARKSTKGDDKQALSIPSQIVALEKIAMEQNLIIVDKITERETAHVPGRPQFNKMMRRIEAGEASGILAWHPDRLARNSKDGGEIIYFLDVGKLIDLKFASFWFENTPQGKSNLGHEFVQTKQYSDKLACDTRRGLREKVRRGEYPSRAPIGYLNDYRTKRIIVDRERAPLVKEAFERYATGTVTLDVVREFFATHKIFTRNGKSVGRAFVSHMFSNPFYYGHFRYAGDMYEGTHEAIISKKLADDAQAVLKRRYKWSPFVQPVKPKAFLGLLHCADCGGAITAEIQKGHTYYRCTKKSRATTWCTQPYVREEVLDADISGLLKPYSLRGDWADDMLSRAREEKKQSAQSAAEVIAEKRAEIETVNLRLQRLLDSLLDGVIERSDYTAEKSKLMSRKKSLEEHMTALSTGQAKWLEPFQEWIKSARNAAEIAVSGSPQEKKALARKVFGSNLVLNCKKARGSCVKPWSLLVENSSSGGVVRARGLEPLIRVFSSLLIIAFLHT
jgi:DNA invertase Pin-like site-specific DNA recombinase